MVYPARVCPYTGSYFHLFIQFEKSTILPDSTIHFHLTVNVFNRLIGWRENRWCLCILCVYVCVHVMCNGNILSAAVWIIVDISYTHPLLLFLYVWEKWAHHK